MAPYQTKRQTRQIGQFVLKRVCGRLKPSGLCRLLADPHHSVRLGPHSSGCAATARGPGPAAAENADASSSWFGPKWTVVQRCLKRYKARAEQQEKNPPNEAAKAVATKANHTFDMMDSCMKLANAYKFGPADAKALTTWMEGLAALTNFLADKDITVGCPYF